MLSPDEPGLLIDNFDVGFIRQSEEFSEQTLTWQCLDCKKLFQLFVSKRLSNMAVL